VDAVGPDVDVVAVGEIALLERLVVGLPCGGEARDGARRETGSILAKQSSQTFLEVTRGQPAQVQDRGSTSATLGERRM